MPKRKAAASSMAGREAARAPKTEALADAGPAAKTPRTARGRPKRSSANDDDGPTRDPAAKKPKRAVPARPAPGAGPEAAPGADAEIDVDAALLAIGGVPRPTADDVAAAVEASWSRRPPASALSCAQAPRGFVDAVEPYLSDDLARFRSLYGPVQARNLKNPDFKRLVKLHGKSLREIIVRPSAPGLRPPKFEGCGYRWLARECKGLVDLEIPLEGDVKRQLLARLVTKDLRRLCLWRAEGNIDPAELIALGSRSPNLTEICVEGLAWDGAGLPDHISFRSL